MTTAPQTTAPNSDCPEQDKQQDTPKAKSAPQRRCLVKGESTTPNGMVRFVVDPNNQVVPDVKGDLPGRGMWVTATRDAVDTAVAKRLFNRGAKRQVSTPDGLTDMVADLLAKRCLQHVSLAHRAGQLVCGRDKARGALESGDGAVLIQASDASPKELDKMAVVARAIGVPVVRPFVGADLAHAVGRDTVVHATLKSSGLADLFLGDVERLQGFGGQTPN